MISRKYNFVFQHIPKCAGISLLNFFIKLHTIEGCIGDLMYAPHNSFSFYKKEYKEHYRNFFKFTFVRNPWDRAVSLYEFRKKEANEGIHRRTWPSMDELINDSFEDTIKKSTNNTNKDVLYLEPAYTDNYWLPKQILKEINFVGRFESIDRDFDYIKYALGIHLDHQLTHDNQIKRKHYSEYYNDETRKIVADKYATDIQLFGYKFED